MITHETDDRLRAWITARDPGPAPATLRASAAQVAFDERRPAGLRRLPPARPAWRIAIAIAAGVVIAIVGIGLMSRDQVGRPAVSPPPTPAATPASATDPLLPRTGAIEPGRYVVSAPRAAVHLTVPADWWGNGMGVGRSTSRGTGVIDLIVTSPDIAYVVPDVCTDEANLELAAVGSRPADLTTALVNEQGVQRIGPTDVTLGGYPAKKFVVMLDPSCRQESGHGIWADAAGAYGAFWLNHGDIGTIFVVDVDGERIVITHRYPGTASAESIAQLEAITASIDIEPVPAPTSSRDPGGWLAVGRHSITVDGVPMSFSVPALVPDRGWNLYGNTEITMDEVGSQGAEAMVYWTAFPDGAQTQLCASLDLPLGGSINDLAHAVSTTPGTTLVSEPTYMTIGGRPTQNVVLTVQEDLGCDPKYFFSSEPPGGGPGWWTTDPGDTIRVWILDVNGTRLFIVGESKPEASQELVQEIGEIVGSIRFN
jgi:hypothetical protein